MAKKDIKFTLDTIDSRYSPVGTVKQLDSVFFYIKITENGVTKDLTGQTIKLFAIKEDKKIVEQTTKINITNQSEGLVEIELLNAAIQVHGFTYFELEISDSNGIISTADFILRVNKRVGSPEAIESTNEVSTLKKVEAYVAKAKVELEEFKKLQSEILSTNGEINTQESLRVNAETKRVQAEKVRIEADKIRDKKVNEYSKKVDNLIDVYKSPQLLDSSNFISGAKLLQTYGVAKPDDLIKNEPDSQYWTVSNIIDCSDSSAKTFLTNLPASTVILGYGNLNGQVVRIESKLLSRDGQQQDGKTKIEMGSLCTKIRLQIESEKIIDTQPILTYEEAWNGDANYMPTPVNTLKNVKLADNSVSENNITEELREKINRKDTVVTNSEILKDKKVVFIGDSIFEGFTGAVNGIVEAFKLLEPNANYVNMGIGGTTIQQNNGIPVNITGKCIYDRINDIPEDADVILFEGGLNDYFQEVKGVTNYGEYLSNIYKMPLSATYEDGSYKFVTALAEFSGGVIPNVLKENTFCGAFEASLIKLITRFWNKIVICVIPHNVNGSEKLNKYLKTERDLCKKYGIPYVDISASGCMPRIYSVAGKEGGTKLTVDAVHPNKLAYKIKYAPPIYSKIKELINNIEIN